MCETNNVGVFNPQGCSLNGRARIADLQSTGLTQDAVIGLIGTQPIQRGCIGLTRICRVPCGQRRGIIKARKIDKIVVALICRYASFNTCKCVKVGDGVCGTVGNENIAPVTTRERVIARSSINCVVASPTINAISTATALNIVITGFAKDGVISQTTVDVVITRLCRWAGRRERDV